MKPSPSQVRVIAILVVCAVVVGRGDSSAQAQDLLDLDLGQVQAPNPGGLASRFLGLALGMAGGASAGSILLFNLSFLLTAGVVRWFRRGRGFEDMVMSRWIAQRYDDNLRESRIEIRGRSPGWPNLLLSWVGMGVSIEFVVACDQARMRRVGVTSERHWAIHLASYPSCSLKFERESFWFFLAMANVGYALIANIDAVALLVLLAAMGCSLGAYFLSGRFALEIADKHSLRLAFRPSFLDGVKLDRAEAVSAFNLLQEMILAANSSAPLRFDYGSVVADEQDDEDAEAGPDADFEPKSTFKPADRVFFSRNSKNQASEEEEDDEENDEDTEHDSLNDDSRDRGEAAARRILDRLKALPRDDPRWRWKMKSGLELIVRDYPDAESARIAAALLAKLKDQPADRRSQS